jgi:hypothetical protein
MANLIQSSFEKVQRYFGGCLGPQFLKAAAERLYGSALPALIVRRPNFWGAKSFLIFEMTDGENKVGNACGRLPGWQRIILISRTAT